jgi:hypothetical protein
MDDAYKDALRKLRGEPPSAEEEERVWDGQHPPPPLTDETRRWIRERVRSGNLITYEEAVERALRSPEEVERSWLHFSRSPEVRTQLRAEIAQKLRSTGKYTEEWLAEFAADVRKADGDS